MKNYDIKAVAYYIARNHPKSCLAYNINHSKYDDEAFLRECLHFFYYEKLGWCGCGTPGEAAKCVRDFLRLTEERDYVKQEEICEELFQVKDIYDNTLLLCLAYTLDNAGFTEHGTGIGGAWLTDEGKMFLDILNSCDDIDEMLL